MRGDILSHKLGKARGCVQVSPRGSAGGSHLLEKRNVIVAVLVPVVVLLAALELCKSRRGKLERNLDQARLVTHAVVLHVGVAHVTIVTRHAKSSPSCCACYILVCKGCTPTGQELALTSQAVVGGYCVFTTLRKRRLQCRVLLPMKFAKTALPLFHCDNARCQSLSLAPQLQHSLPRV